jgi:DNA-binding HxlR family transcriptional regulator
VTRTRLTGVACSIARATDLFADAWTALIMRDVLLGVQRFDDLVEDLGISRKVLAARLGRLVEEGVLVRERYRERPPREHYRATVKGEQLYPVLLALMDWGDRWYAGDAGPPALLRHHDCGHRTTPVTVCEHCSEPLTVHNTSQSAGPGGRVGPGTRVLGQVFTTGG